MQAGGSGPGDEIFARGAALTSSIAIGGRKRRFGVVNLFPQSTRAIGLAFILATGMAHPGRAADGAVIYENNCASCHGLDGRARTPVGRKLGARDLSESKLADDAIAALIRNGVKSPQGTEKMPPFKERLNPEETAAVAAFVKTFRKK